MEEGECGSLLSFTHLTQFTIRLGRLVGLLIHCYCNLIISITITLSFAVPETMVFFSATTLSAKIVQLSQDFGADDPFLVSGPSPRLVCRSDS